jgi:NADPH:quinone reductase-like Zn-dependent oxidoreductase
MRIKPRRHFAMKAMQLTAHGKPGKFNLRDLPDPKPGPEDVTVQVRACGVNRLDLWVEEGTLPVAIDLPRTPGSEISGSIVELGEDVDEWRLGDRVTVQSNLFCGECEFCLRGDESLCLRGQSVGVDVDGGFAEKVVVPWRSLVRLPVEIGFATASALSLAGSTAMHMLTDRAEVSAGNWVLVAAGASGVGSAAIQIARALGARVISTGSTEAKRAFCLRLGAEHALDTSHASWITQVRQITEKRGVDLIIEHVGGTLLEQCFQCLARGGTIVTCGATEGRKPTLPLWPFFVKQHRLIGSYGRNRADLTATLEWAAQGKLRPTIDRAWPLTEVPAALNLLRARAVLGKVIIDLSLEHA